MAKIKQLNATDKHVTAVVDVNGVIVRVRLNNTFKKEESGLMEVEQYPTLAARDAYAARGGYVSGRSASVNTYHIKHGRITTHKITPEMLKEEVA